MKKTNIFLIVIALIGAGVAAFLPMKDNNKKEIAPDKLHAELNLNSRFFSTDQVADLLINQDPSLLLIDVRKELDFKNFHLPEAINIPLEKILDSSSLNVLAQSFRKKVFYSNGTADATVAWSVARRNNFENIFILDGGLNCWYETILNPAKPNEANANQKELDLYRFRLAASQFFGNSKSNEINKNKSVQNTDKKKIIIVKKASPSGGC